MEKYEKRNRLEEALRLRGLKQIDLVDKTGIDKASINSYCKQRWQPKQKNLMKMARALKVSEMWLAGYDVPMERPTAQVKNDILVDVFDRIKNDEAFKDLIIKINTLDKSGLDQIIQLTDYIYKVNHSG